MTKTEWKEIQSIYTEAGLFFERIERILRKQKDRYYGFKILNSPPRLEPEHLFVGYQPGGSSAAYDSELAKGTHKGWPDDPEYITADWRLARQMQSIFSMDILARSVGLNAIFLRWPNVQGYKVDVPSHMRAEVESFSAAKVQRIIEIMQPKKIVALGFATLRMSGVQTTREVDGASGGSLILKGRMWGYEAIGLKHLSGSRISNEDKLRIRRYIGTEAPNS